MGLKKYNCFQLCCCTILAENVAPRAKFRLVENRLKSDAYNNMRNAKVGSIYSGVRLHLDVRRFVS